MAPPTCEAWEVVDGRMKGHVERIEQGNRITITVGGLVHDMFCDGTLESGVDDIAGFDGDRIVPPRRSRMESISSARSGESSLP